ncbi:MAG: glycoside hydrolase family 2 protein [Oscillospiraceae bacterium]
MLTADLNRWKMEGYYPNVPLQTRSMETGELLGGMFYPMDADVPGSVYAPLLREGLIPDPYVDMNSLACEWVKDRWWLYTTKFRLPESKRGRNIRLRVCGADYRARIALNGEVLGVHENMFTPFVSRVEEQLKWGEDNQVSILLEHAPDETGQIGYTSKTFTQKARFAYKWDFCTRLVQLGLHEPVYLEDFGACAIEYADIRTEVKEGEAVVSCSLELTAFRQGPVDVEFALTAPDGSTAATARERIDLSREKQTCSAQMKVENPRMWYPSGYGEQPLYRLAVRILDGDGLSDEKEYTVGIRRVEYLRCEGAAADSLPYRVAVNGIPVYIRGVNMVPLDHMYADIAPERYEQTVRKMAEGNVNLVRVWGGGLIEREAFYDACDRHGIMIWQEFVQSSSGLDNVPSQLPEFLEKLEASAREAVKVKRNHVSLTFWSGGNELMQYPEGSIPADYTNANIAMLRDVVAELNPDILMLPTSASGPREFIDVTAPGTNHDVHGPWKYEGVEAHYSLYNRSDSQLHSEFGTDGMSCLETVERVLSPGNRGIRTSAESIVWRHKGADWWDTVGREEGIFGPFDRERELELFIQCSQFIQAESIRYSLEANRRRAFANAGSIIWQFNEPWPNVSATNLVDYYGNPKMAYFAMRDAFRPVNPNLKYHRLVVRPGDSFPSEVWLSRDDDNVAASVSLDILDSTGNSIRREEYATAPGSGHSCRLGELTHLVGQGDSFTVRLTAEQGGCKTVSEYVILIADVAGTCSKAVAARNYKAMMMSN